MANIDDIVKLINASNTKETNDKCVSKTVLAFNNLGWIIILLIIALCCLLSIDINELKNKNLIGLINNFATLLSIILSISSILFAYFTSRDTNNQYIAMGKALEEVRAANFQIIISNSDLVSQVNDIAKDISSLNSKYDLRSMLDNNMRNTTSDMKGYFPDNKQTSEAETTPPTQ